MPLVLSIPGLLAGDRLPPARSLARLLSHASARRDDAGIAAFLAQRYGVVRQIDWPLAPILAAALGVDVGDAHWLCANPVTLVAGRDDVILERRVRDLSIDDARALVTMLNAHFSEDGIAFVAPRPDAWFVRARSAPALATHSLHSAVGRTLRTRLPDGRDAPTWRRWQNEIQMLLFEHPVNVTREREGKPPANSVWLEYGGTLQARATSTHAIRTWSDDATAAALAAFAATPARSLPRSLAPVLADAAHDDASVVAFDAPVDLDAFEHDFAAPALDALLHGDLDGVVIVSDGDGAAIEWTAGRPSRWSRWTGRFAGRDLATIVNARTPASNI